jgi:hypothetical protein
VQLRGLQLGVEVIRGAPREAPGCEAAAWPRQSHDTLIGRPMLNRDLRQQELASRSQCANLLAGDRWSTSTVPTLNSVGAGQRLLLRTSTDDRLRSQAAAGNSAACATSRPLTHTLTCDGCRAITLARRPHTSSALGSTSSNGAKCCCRSVFEGMEVRIQAAMLVGVADGAAGWVRQPHRVGVGGQMAGWAALRVLRRTAMASRPRARAAATPRATSRATGVSVWPLGAGWVGVPTGWVDS